ncbi:DUF3108 domain-containing protein [Ferrimonas lipolytica]|uniref:DUF3108 domain-containing protein n=1 Tax=Ferrimonas lipolytica TaxID=2724191 RepID=A0A6H1UEG2_9GAMM|nr:DUF3108 domain-containing protein [Ferrimonas lipolytica]QIZ76182.1 DUF3108 domain-containing protein [Ferrimonas lipolytica]
MRLIAALSLLFCCKLMAAPLTPFEANYDVTHGDSSLGGGKITLQKTATNQFQMGYVSDVGWLLLSDIRSEQSLFDVNGDTLIPKRYLMERSGSGPDFSAEVEFDSVTGQIHARYKDRAADFPYKLPIYDNILYLMQLRLDVAAGKTQMNYHYIQKTKQRNIIYHVVGEEQLTTPFGTLNTVKVARIRKADSPKQTFAWLAKDHNYVIAQIQHYEDGELKAGMELQKVTFGQE